MQRSAGTDEGSGGGGGAETPAAAAALLAAFVDRHPRLFVLTGAGCSTGSGIPDYRDGAGQWKRKPPVTYQAFTGQDATRKRYWARSMMGWPLFLAARPNAAHLGLARLEAAGAVELLLTQNVDRLHQQAGSRRVVDLHGRLDRVICLACGHLRPRQDLQRELEAANPECHARWGARGFDQAPDGDVDLDNEDFSDFVVPDCRRCAGMLKPDVVFFGESVPRPRVEQAWTALEQADGVLVVGSSLMVHSGFRFVQRAAAAGLPIVALNRGHTRADALLSLKLDHDCGAVFAAWHGERVEGSSGDGRGPVAADVAPG